MPGAPIGRVEGRSSMSARGGPALQTETVSFVTWNLYTRQRQSS